GGEGIDQRMIFLGPDIHPFQYRTQAVTGKKLTRRELKVAPLAKHRDLLAQRIRHGHVLAPAPERCVIAPTGTVMQNNEIADLLIIHIDLVSEQPLYMAVKISIRQVAHNMNQRLVN